MLVPGPVMCPERGAAGSPDARPWAGAGGDTCGAGAIALGMRGIAVGADTAGAGAVGADTVAVSAARDREVPGSPKRPWNGSTTGAISRQHVRISSPVTTACVRSAAQ